MRHPLALLALFALSGCGGGGGATPIGPPPAPVSIDIALEATRTGFATSTGNATANVAPGAGDLADNSEQRGFYSFPLGAIPNTATLQAAVLRVQQTGTLGTPYTDFTGLSVDSVDLGAALDPADFAVAALSTPGLLNPADAVIGVKTLDVQAQVAADRTALRQFSAFRLMFIGAPNADNGGDRATLGLSAPGTETVLRVTYLP